MNKMFKYSLLALSTLVDVNGVNIDGNRNLMDDFT